MVKSIVDGLLVSGGLMFIAAAVLSARNYWTTRGVTQYWLLVSVAAVLGTAWAGVMMLDTVAGMSDPLVQAAQLPLAVAAFIGYAVSVVKASATEVVAEVV